LSPDMAADAKVNLLKCQVNLIQQQKARDSDR
jgi:hypothetical protein